MAEALEQAALEQGEDADDLGLLEDLPLADLQARVEAARAIIEESVAANDARALANSIAVLGRLLGTAATAEALQADDNLKAVEEALRAVGIDNTASSEAAAEIADALMQALTEEGRDAGEDASDVLAAAGDLEDDDDVASDGPRDADTVAAAAGALLEDAAARSDADDMADALGVLRDFVAGGSYAHTRVHTHTLSLFLSLTLSFSSFWFCFWSFAWLHMLLLSFVKKCLY